MKFEHVKRLDKDGKPLVFEVMQKKNNKPNPLYKFFDTSPGWRKVKVK